MEIIKKVLNSSVVLVEDERGVERILLGKGIGFGQKPGAVVPAGAEDRVFVPLSEPDKNNFVELLSQVRDEYLNLTRDIVRIAEEDGLTLDAHIYLALTDHLHFAAERVRTGMRIVNRLAWEVRTIYPRQYAVAVRGLALAKNQLAIEFPEEEAANIAFHLINADTGTASTDSMRVVELVGSIITIATHAGHIRIQEGNLHAARLVTHLQYFAERLFAGRLLTSEDDFLYFQLSNRYPDAIAAADRIRTFIEQKYGTDLPHEEVAYLALHIARAGQDDGKK